MPSTLKSAAVRWIKPAVPESTWQMLRRAGGGATPPPPPRPSLTDLARKHRTDKWGAHRYTPHYQHHLRHLRDQEFVLLEIGIGGYAREGRGGASLRMWKDFFPRAQIVGLDIEDKSFVEEPRIRAYQGSQVDAEILERIVAEQGRPTVIIDDGSHRPEHIRETFRLLFPELADDGIYAIEDTQTSYWPRWGGSMDRQFPFGTMALVKDLLDGLNYQEFLDRDYEPTYTDRHVIGLHAYHNLVILEKGINDEGSKQHEREQRLAYEALEAEEQGEAGGASGAPVSPAGA